MATPLGTTLRDSALAVAALATITGAVAQPAQAQNTLIPGVTGCDAPGGQQTGGALIGALVGGALGNSVSRHNRGVGTVAGAALGGGVGSYVGCQRQEARVREQGYQQPSGYQQNYNREQPAYSRSYSEPGYASTTSYADNRYRSEPAYGTTLYDSDGNAYRRVHYRRVAHRTHHHPIYRASY